MKVYQGFEAYFKEHPPLDHETLSFHHHLRNGDHVLDPVMRFYHAQHDLKLCPSSLFPTHAAALTPLIENQQIVTITTSYCSGPLAHVLKDHPLKKGLHLDSHGGRARRLVSLETPVDRAFCAVPAVDHQGQCSGFEGPNACGSLGYMDSDLHSAKHVILVTDHYVKTLQGPGFDGRHAQAVIVVDSIGKRAGMASGTTQINANPLHDLIAKKTVDALHALDALPDGVSFQTGAGSISLRIARNLHQHFLTHDKHARFVSGGITAYHVKMLEEGTVKKLYDVQCFDTVAADSLLKNKHHHAISARRYADVLCDERVIKDLDVVILGAGEIDLTFNVNVTTDYRGVILGGSGGHLDTASDAKLTVIVSPLLKGRMPLIVDEVTVLTTPGQHIDMLVTEYGVCVNPLRVDLIEKAQAASLPLVTIEALQEKAHAFAGRPAKLKRTAMNATVYDRHLQPIDRF